MNNLLDYLKQTKIQILIIVILTGLSYSNSLGNGLVWDDHLFLEQWPDIQSFQGLENVLKGSAPPSQDKIFRPIRGLIYIVDYSLWGVNSFGYHFQALLIHLGVTLLVYGIALNIFKNLASARGVYQSSIINHKSAAFLTALLFGLHPIHTETINYISASMETWGSLFFFLSFYLYLESSSKFKVLASRSGQSSKLLYVGSIVSAWVAFFTYEMTLTLPLLIVLYDVILRAKPEGSRFFSASWRIARRINIVRLKWRTTLIYLPYFLGVAVFLIIRTATLGLISRTDYLGYSFYLTQLVMVKVFVRYISLLIFPINQTAIHNLVEDFPSSMIPYDSLEPILNQSIFDWDVLISAALLLGLIIFAIKYIKKYPLISFCILWFFISLLPVSYIIPHGGAMAEKYLYIASFGFCLLLAYLLYFSIHFVHSKNTGIEVRDIVRVQSRTTVFFVFLFLLLTFYFVSTFNRNFVWKNDISLFSDVVAKSPGNLIANYTLGIWYGRNNDLAKSEEHYKKALEKAPEFFEARYNLGNLYLRGKDFDKATTEYDTLVKTHPELKLAKNALSNIQLLRESSKSGILNDQILVHYKSKNGFEFLFPVHWRIESKDQKEILKDANEQIKVELQKEDLRLKINDLGIEEYLKGQTQNYGKLVNQGKALIPGWDSAYVRVWEEESGKGTAAEGEPRKDRGYRGQKLEFYLFKDSKVIKVLVNPVIPSLMGEFDGILGSIKIE